MKGHFGRTNLPSDRLFSNQHECSFAQNISELRVHMHKAPIAPKKPHTLSHHGIHRVDPYFWMNDRENPDVISYLEAENEYLKQALSHTETLQEELFSEMKGKMAPREESAPNLIDGWYYYSRYEEGKEHPIHLRRKDEVGAVEDIILDVNELAEGHAFCSVMGMKVSADHHVLAFAVDFQGRRICDLYIKNLETGETYPDLIHGVTGNMAWAMDHQTLFYSRMDEQTLRPHQIFRHVLGNDPAEDPLVFEELDETFRCGISRSKSKAFLFVHCSSTMTDEVRLLDAYQPEGGFQVFRSRERGHEYNLDHYDGKFYILSNEHAINFQLLTCPEDQQDPKHWSIRILHREDTLLEGFNLFEDELILEERRNGLTHLRILSRVGESRDEYLTFHDPAYATGLAYNPDPERPVLRYHYESLTTPASQIELNLKTGEETTIWQKQILGGFDSNQYRSERLFATAADGTRIPISLVYHIDTPLDGSAPLLLYGYGSYGLSVDPYFSLSRLSLLDRGFICAIAHIRGGSEMGRSWYENGRKLQKMNTFTDFIVCGEHLLRIKYTRKEHLFCIGGSAGGMLVGAVINIRPDLFRGAVAAVPFVDVVTTMLDDSIPLTTGEYDEWGNPNNKEFFDYMLSYSPYDNVKAQDYPHLLITSGLHDSQVQYWEPTKWIAKLRDVKTNDRYLFLHTNMDAGHGGSSGRFEALREVALEYAFLLDLADTKEPNSPRLQNLHEDQ